MLDASPTNTSDMVAQVAFTFAVEGREDCHNPSNLKWGLNISYFKVVKNGEVIFPGYKWLILVVPKLYFVLSLMKYLPGKYSIDPDILFT